MDRKAREDKAHSEHERALQEYSVRTLPLGRDRAHSEYWAFPHDDRCDDTPLAPLLCIPSP